MLPPLLPFGGAAAITVYLLWVLWQRERSWREERAQLIQERREDLVELERRYKADREQRDIDYQRHVNALRDRIDELTSEIAELRAELRKLRILIEER